MLNTFGKKKIMFRYHPVLIVPSHPNKCPCLDILFPKVKILKSPPPKVYYTSPSKQPSNVFENSNGGAKVVSIALLRHHALPVHCDHVGAGLGAQTPQIHLRGTFDSDHVLLTGFGCEACLPVIVKKGVESALQDMLVDRRVKDDEEKYSYPAP